jgi:hypothetical protein
MGPRATRAGASAADLGGVRVGDELYAISFEVYECTEVREGAT